MPLNIQAISLANNECSDGALVLNAGRLVAVLSRLSDTHDELNGHWFVEFIVCDNMPTHQTFADIESACRWIEGGIG